MSTFAINQSIIFHIFHYVMTLIKEGREIMNFLIYDYDDSEKKKKSANNFLLIDTINNQFSKQHTKIMFNEVPSINTPSHCFLTINMNLFR